jgi:RNA recognition motif-containing protein
MKLLVRNLARTTTEQALREMFEAHGKVQSCSLVIDKNTGKSKGFAFVEIPRPGDAKAAVKTLNGKELYGNIIRVKKAAQKKAPTETPEAKKPVEETSKAEAPEAEAPKAEAPKAELPEAATPEAEFSPAEKTDREKSGTEKSAEKESAAINRNIWSK